MFVWLILFLASSSLIEGHHDSLRLVNLVFRHGQRTPASTYPNDPYINETFTPYGWGQLTNEGKQKQYEQGVWLRERYSHLLGDQYNGDLLSAMTTDVDRTKTSIQYMFAGLLPPAGPQIWNEGLRWQAIPTSHEKLEEDKLLLVRGCDRYTEARKEVLKTEAVQEIMKSQKDLYEYLTKHAGVEVADPWGVEDIYSTLKAEEDYKLTLPDWTKEVYPDKMRDATEYSFVLNCYNDELKRIKGGPLLKKILQDSKMKAENKLPKERKLYAYAGHDATVANLLMAMGVWDKQIPVYNIMAIIELHETDNNHGLKIYLRNSTNSEPYELKLPNCESPCPLDKAYSILSPVIPSDIKTACLAKNETYVAPEDGHP